MKKRRKYVYLACNGVIGFTGDRACTSKGDDGFTRVPERTGGRRWGLATVPVGVGRASAGLETTCHRTQHRRHHWCGGRRRVRRVRAGFEIDHSEPLASRVAISRAAGPDGARNTREATSNIKQEGRRPRAHQAARPNKAHEAPGTPAAPQATQQPGTATTHPGIQKTDIRDRMSACGGARGIRTPDLLIANETRYQLRHSPKDSNSLAPWRSATQADHDHVRDTTDRKKRSDSPVYATPLPNTTPRRYPTLRNAHEAR